MSIFSQHSRPSSRGPASTRRLRRGGFTLIELLVVMAIMIIVTTVLLVRQSRFDSSTLLRSLAYSVAVSVRQAQVYGTSVLGTTTVAVGNCTGGSSYQSGGCYAAAYGIHFAAGTTGSYTLFADLNGDGKYESGEDVKVFKFNTGYTVSTVCALVGSILDCTAACPLILPSGASSCTASFFSSFVDIVFRRPNPDACFSTDAQATACLPPNPAVYTSAYIQVSGGDNTRGVTITQPGQISVGVAGT